jgi:hypothetical protein
MTHKDLAKKQERKNTRRKNRKGRRLNHGCAELCKQQLFSTTPTLKSGTRKLVETAFGWELHHKQVLSLFMIVVGLLFSKRLGIAAVGLAMSRTFGKQAKHSKKQVDRFLSNKKLPLQTLFNAYVPFMVGNRTKIEVAMDWTEFDKNDHSTLSLSLVTNNRRTQPLVWFSVVKSNLKGKLKAYERKALRKLKSSLPSDIDVIIVADRGFGDVERYNFIRKKLGYHFVIRYRQDTYVNNHDGWLWLSRMLVPKNGRCRVIRNTFLTGAEKGPYSVVLYKARGMKEPWCLATSLDVSTGKDIVNIYSRRFRCEECFRDIKDARYGYGLKLTNIKRCDRRDRLLFVFSVAYLVHTLLGITSERLGLDRQLRANTETKRTHSLFQQGQALIGDFKRKTFNQITSTFRVLLKCLNSNGIIDALA